MLLSKYRVEEVKTMLEDPKNSDESLIILAYDAGFKSKSNFNAAFKKHTGQTPTAYRKALSN